MQTKARTLTLVLPWPPSVNTYYAVVRGRKILSRAGRQYKIAVAEAVLKQIPKHHSLIGRLRVSIWLTMPDRRTRDISNAVKAVEDALTNAYVWLDDEQIDQLLVYRLNVSKPGRAVVRIRQLT